ncbi:MAG TPA: tetratricopeptide repeat protein, partial [Gemmatimonadaceae bacterium]|nr:tetratricopeptide repeat protein [Gemmatimonadaceae bacterium]
ATTLPLPFDSLRASVDRALVTSRAADYERALSLVDAALARRPDDAVLLHYRGFLLYREGSFLTATGRDAKRARARFEDAERTLERSAAALPWPETMALQSAVVGQLIGLGGPLAGMRLGAKANRLLEAALAAGPDNPRVWMLKGVSDLYRPKLLGGSTAKAEASLRKALALFVKDAPAPPAPWWGHAETYGWLGQVYVKEGRLDEARAAYAKALDLQPGNAWVLEFLLPAVRDARR